MRRNKEILKVVVMHLLIIIFIIAMYYYFNNFDEIMPKDFYIFEIIFMTTITVFLLIIMSNTIKQIVIAYKIIDESFPKDTIFDDILIYVSKTSEGYHLDFYPIIKKVSNEKRYLIPNKHNYSRFIIKKTQSLIGNKYAFEINGLKNNYTIIDANSMKIDIGDNVLFYSKDSYEKCKIDNNNISIDNIVAPYYDKNSEINPKVKSFFININH